MSLELDLHGIVGLAVRQKIRPPAFNCLALDLES